MVDIRTGHSTQKTKQETNKPKEPKSKQIFFKAVRRTMVHEQEKNLKNNLVSNEFFL